MVSSHVVFLGSVLAPHRDAQSCKISKGPKNCEDISDFDDFLTKSIAAPSKFASAKKSQRANDETTTDEKVYRRPFCYKSFRRVQNINAHMYPNCTPVRWPREPLVLCSAL